MNIRLATVLLTFSGAAICATSTHTWTDCPRRPLSTNQINNYFDAATATLTKSGATDMAADLTAAGTHEDASRPKRNGEPYWVFHVVRWSDLANGRQTVAAQNWYVYHQGRWSDAEFTNEKRIYGAKDIRLVYVHFNRDVKFFYSATYKLEVTAKTAAWLVNLTQLAGLFGLTDAPGAGGSDVTDAVFGVHQFVIDDVPSDLKITPVYDVLSATCIAGAPPSSDGSFSPSPAAGSGFAPAPEAAPPATSSFAPAPGTASRNPSGPIASPAPFRRTGTQVAGLEGTTIDNEGRYPIDFSIGVPLTKISELEFSQGRTGLTAKKVEKQNAYGLFNLYFRPVDVKRKNFHSLPYLVTGAKIGNQPFKKLILAGGWGPVLANFYAGILFNTQSLPADAKCGRALTTVPEGAVLRNKTCAEFTFGINLPISRLLGK